MLNPTDSSRTPATRADRLRALRPTRPVVMVAGIAALASATGVGIASGAPDHADATQAVAAVAATAPDNAPDKGKSEESRPSRLLAEKHAREAAEARAAAEAKAAADAAEAARVAAEQKVLADRAAAEAASRAAARPAVPVVAPAPAAAPASAPAKPAAPAASASGYVRPVAGTPHGSYGRSGSLWSHGHTGEDFAASSGTPVKAVAAGTVVKTGWGGAYGNEVVIRHADGKYTQYGHLSKFSISAGATVSAGQQVGAVGSTGNSTGPHLHFEVRTGPAYGSDVNPIAYLRAKGVAI